ncbi:helix-hairpin-helix domain-containing protein [bacterium]|nr:helix-hairpin-helix domain-containing protein [bacterium]
MTRRFSAITGLLAAGVLAVLLGTLPACQGDGPGIQSPQPRSREAAADKDQLPGEADTSNRYAISTDGGVVEYRKCVVSIPRGAFPETVFVEISIPAEPPLDILADTAFQVNPDGLELAKDGVIAIGYYDDEVPPGKDEENLVIVHQVNGVWVELTDSKVHVYNNTIEAPIHYLGLYAVRVANEDPRRLNSEPVASFQFSTEPFPEMLGKPFEQAQAETAPESTAPADEGKVNINTAEKEDLLSVPGMDETLAQRIVDYRNQNGQFGEVRDLLKINGIGEETLAEMEPALTIGAAPVPSNLVNINTATRDELLKVTGLTDVLADEIINYRNQNGPFAEPGDLLKISGMRKNMLDQMLPEITTGTAAPAEEPGDQALILERRLVAGPADANVTAGNVAEGSGPLMTDVDSEIAKAVAAETPEVKVYFDASASYDPDGKIVQYDWDFDADGIFDYTSHSTPYAEHVFRYNGDYTIVLKVTDNGRYARSGFGTGVMKVRNANAEPKPLAANISCFPPYGPSPLTVNYAAAVSGGVPPYAFTWTFDDDSKNNLPNPLATYPECGTHSVRFKVVDIEGNELTGSLMAQVCDPERPAEIMPRMQLDVTPYAEQGYAPLTAKFSLKIDRATAPVTYRVTFGDEGPDEDELVTYDTYLTHYYGNSGFYLMKIIATDADLRTATAFATVHVLSPDIERDFTVSELGLGSDPFSFGHTMRIQTDYTSASPRTVRFKPADTPKLEDELGYQWDFGDGTYATESKPAHTYARDGVYEVRLTASDGLQRWRHRIWLPISSEDPAVAIQLPSYVEGPAPLHLDLDAIVTRGEQPFRYDWIIGNNRRSEASTHFAFQLPGDYELRLDVYDKYNEPIHSPPVEVRVRPGPVDYRVPLAVIEPLTGSTRAVVVDYNAANPLPLSSPHVEGPVRLLDLSANGRHLGIVGDEGLLVKRVSNATPVLAFLPAAGEIVALSVLNSDSAYVTLESAGGLATYLLRADHDPAFVGNGRLLTASGDGDRLVLAGPADGNGAAKVRLISADADAAQFSEPAEIAGVVEAVLTADGRSLFYLDKEMRLVRANLASDETVYLSRGEDNKRHLAISADGSAVAFVSELGTGTELIYGRYLDTGEFRLASVTDTTGFFSDYPRLSDDGRYLLAYGSRDELFALLDAAEAPSEPADAGEAFEDALQTAASNDVIDEADAPDGEIVRPRPPARRERLGVIRLNLSRAPDSWKITTVSPEFVTEAEAIFDTAGPFGH